MKKYFPAILLAAALLLAGGIILGLSAAGAHSLQRQMSGVWYRDGGDQWHLELDVSDDTIEYNFVSAEFPDMSETIYSYGCTVKNASIALVQYPEGEKRVTVSFSPDGSEMTFTPAVTSAEDSETWKRQ